MSIRFINVIYSTTPYISWQKLLSEPIGTFTNYKTYFQMVSRPSFALYYIGELFHQIYINNTAFLKWEQLASQLILNSDNLLLYYVLDYVKNKIILYKPKINNHRDLSIYNGIPEYEKFAGYWNALLVGRCQMLLGHALQNSHKRCDETVYVALVMCARSLQYHQSAKELRVRACRGLLIRVQPFIYNLLTILHSIIHVQICATGEQTTPN